MRPWSVFVVSDRPAAFLSTGFQFRCRLGSVPIMISCWFPGVPQTPYLTHISDLGWRAMGATSTDLRGGEMQRAPGPPGKADPAANPPAVGAEYYKMPSGHISTSVITSVIPRTLIPLSTLSKDPSHSNSFFHPTMSVTGCRVPSLLPREAVRMLGSHWEKHECVIFTIPPYE